MKWTRSETLALSSATCPRCNGLGLCHGRGNNSIPCHCVTRAIFHACFNRFRASVQKDKGACIVNLERIGTGRSSHMTFGRKTEEYIADFYLTCKRTLTASEWHTFRVAYLSGVPWSVCHKRLNMLRTNFMQACYRLEAKLGRAFRETEPFGLYPLNEYFGTVVRGAHVAVIVPMVPRVVPVRPPMAAA